MTHEPFESVELHVARARKMRAEAARDAVRSFGSWMTGRSKTR